MSTIHSNSARDALSRIENMIMMGNVNLPTKAIRAQVASAVDLVIQTERMRDGKRRVTELTEVVGMEEDIIVLSNLFTYEYLGENVDGTLNGRFVSQLSRPRFLHRLDYYGLAQAFLDALGVPDTMEG
jgi:pilus assembly protein CpaF